MALTREKLIEAIQLARGKRETLQDQLNASMGFIQALEMTLGEMDKPDDSGSELEIIPIAELTKKKGA